MRGFCGVRPLAGGGGFGSALGTMKARLLEFLTLVAVLALAAQYAGNERRDSSLNRALSLDGVRIGMSYEQVLEVLSHSCLS